ncbi:transposable element Tcb1 transposase [Trichonephila clavipes]|nr:transposable element Tcb1 transposase [Trichonephila clavipes]
MWVAEWNEAVFTGESRICLQQHVGRIRVWIHRGERRLNNCVIHHHTGPALGIMAWGGIGYHSRTPLVRVAGVISVPNQSVQRHTDEVAISAIAIRNKIESNVKSGDTLLNSSHTENRKRKDRDLSESDENGYVQIMNIVVKRPWMLYLYYK